MAKDQEKAKYADILLRPRITEKANNIVEKGVYTFEVSEAANKRAVAQAVNAFYNVVPIKIRITKNPAKKVIVRGKKGLKAGVKKAYVYLKKGDKLE